MGDGNRLQAGTQPVGDRKGWREIYTPANIVTITRMLLIPVFLVLMLAPWADWMPKPMIAEIIKPWVAAGVFILLAATDRLDGYLARSRGEVTTFGVLLDPLADKILVAAALLVLIELQMLPAWIALIILGREFLVSGLRMVAAAEGKVIAASNLGKSKTVMQIVAVVVFIVKGSLETIWNLFLDQSLVWLINLAAWITMGLTVLITIVSLVDYFMNSAEVLGFERTGPWARKAEDRAETDEVEATDASMVSTAGSAMDFWPEVPLANDCDAQIALLARTVVEQARAAGVSIGTAESCTGGLIAAALTDVAGASDVFKGAIVSYANTVKQDLLSVSADVLAEDGAVSEACVAQMANQAKKALDVDLAVAVSGIAGPGGGTDEKPVGLIWLAVGDLSGTQTLCQQFSGGREEVRKQAVRSALLILHDNLVG